MTYNIPTGGVSVAGPAALLAAIAKGGIIQAGPGAYGVLNVMGAAPAQPAIVVCDSRAHFERITFGRGAKHITFVEPNVWPDKTAPVRDHGVIDADQTTSHIEIHGANVMSAPDARVYYAWDAARWAARRTHGIVLDGPDSRIDGGRITATRIAMVIRGSRSGANGVKVRGFSEDGDRVEGYAPTVDQFVTSCDIADCVTIDATHPDGSQAFSRASRTSAPGTGLIERPVWRGNLLREWIGPAGHALRGRLQGICGHDGTFKDLIAEDNVIWTRAWNGLRFAKVTGGRIGGNRIYDADRKSHDRRIHLVGSSGVLIEDNITGKIIVGARTLTLGEMGAGDNARPDYATLPAMSLAD